ncbi:MAG: glycosyltransferase [Candidatus Berkelbacteria bacterium]|nr:glycosyltransferase [Candidatus Berkelbacteria bacterium]
MNILVVHETEYLAKDKMVFEYQIIPEIWANKGHQVFVLDYPTHWRKKHFFDFGYARSQIIRNIRRSSQKKGITLIRPAIVKVPGLARIVAVVSYFFLIPKIIRKYKIERIFLYSVPTNGLQTIFWARRFKVPVHFRLLDVLHRLVPNKFLSSPTYLLEKIVYPRVSELTAITPRLTKYAISMGANKRTASYLPSASDSELFYPQRKDPKLLRKFLIKRGELTLLFAGTLYGFSGLDRIIEFWGKHKDEFLNLKLIVCGDGSQKKLLEKLIEKYALGDQIFLTGFINYLKLPKYINLADICINPFEINEITKIIFPGKIYQYMACGKPTIATRLKGVLDIFPDLGGKNGIYYFSLSRPREFFELAHKIGRREIKDPNPQLNEIAGIIEKRLLQLKVKSEKW